MSLQIEIAGIGACVADTLYTLNGFPREDTKKGAVVSRQVGGGPAATGLVAASRLGCRTAYLGTLSEDAAGTFLEQDFERYAVDTKGVTRYGAEYRSFTSCIWLNQASGSRTCVFDKGSLPAYQITEEGRKILQQAKILMVDGNDMDAAIEGAKLIHEAGGLVLYDAGGLYENVEKLLPHADILIPSAEFARGFTGSDSLLEAALTLYEVFHPRVVVITNGKEGGVRYDGRECVRYAAFPTEVVDSNGAGDVFHGAFAAGLIKGYSYGECCVFASMVSSLKCQGLGARESIPDFETTICALREKGVKFE